MHHLFFSEVLHFRRRKSRHVLLNPKTDMEQKNCFIVDEESHSILIGIKRGSCKNQTGLFFFFLRRFLVKEPRHSEIIFRQKNTPSIVRSTRRTREKSWMFRKNKYQRCTPIRTFLTPLQLETRFRGQNHLDLV